ncbi:MAG: glycosyltransferase family 4 protein [Planctomycetota bacterium]
MNILYHHRTAADDGQAVHIRELQRAFTRAGHEIREVAIVKRADPKNPHRQSWMGKLADAAPAFVREWMEHGYDLAGARALRAAIRERRPDLIYERYALSTSCGATVAKEFQLPYVLEVNSPLVDEVARTRGLAFPNWARRKEMFILNSATIVAVVSGALGDWAITCGVHKNRIIITPNGVELARYRNLTKRADLIDRWNLAGKRIIGFTGFVRDWHRLDLALQAMKQKALDRLGAVLVIVGEGPALAQLEQFAHELSLSESVRFCGKVAHDEIPDYVALFDMALVTAINPYASPLKLFEYLAAGVPVATVDQPNLREVLDNNCAEFFASGDVARLAEILNHWVANPEKARAAGEAGRKLLIERDYTWDGNVKRIFAALAGAGSPAKVNATLSK